MTERLAKAFVASAGTPANDNWPMQQPESIIRLPSGARHRGDDAQNTAERAIAPQVPGFDPFLL